MADSLDSPESQTSSTVLMVRGTHFGFNPETAATNAFSRRRAVDSVAARALAEFDALAARLDGAGVEVLTLDDAPEPAKPDALFPNNWVSFHGDGSMILYPMAADSRRAERVPDSVRGVLEKAGFEVRHTVDLSEHERHGRFLEGTGSLILDRPGRRAYAALGPRTDAAAIADFDARRGYSTFCFDAADAKGRPIYHTNVLMSLGTRWAVVCMDSIAERDRAGLARHIDEGGRRLIQVGLDQLRQFACNIIELRKSSGEAVIAMSTAAKRSLRPEQRRALELLGGELVDSPIPTIEAVGGGSVRCMVADVHLPRRIALPRA